MPPNRLILEDGNDFLLDDFDLTFGQNELLDGIVTYLSSIIDVDQFNYVGKLQAINSREDYENFPTGVFPFIGVAMPVTDFGAFETLGTNYPVSFIQIIYAFKTSGSSGDVINEDLTQYWSYMKDLRTLLLHTGRNTRFHMPNNILSMKLMKEFAFPSFYTEIDKNRKCFHIGFFQLLLELSGI